LVDESIDGSVNIEESNVVEECGLDTDGSVQGPVPSLCEYGNELSCP
jgi:hypothetical protein